LLVDEILGPEEVVVRPLPPLLRHQPIFAGLTLSSTGETVLLLDSQQLSELASARPTVERLDRPQITTSQSDETQQTFLVVDDSLSARKCLTKALHKWGYQTVEAADGLEAMERVESSNFAAVFSDLEMPRQDGFGLLHDIKSDERFRHLPVVIVSSRHEEEYRKRAQDLGAFAYVTKPFDEATLFAMIGKLPIEQRKEG
jgi:CheY-like chemotaxis protein